MILHLGLACAWLLPLTLRQVWWRRRYLADLARIREIFAEHLPRDRVS
jgi:hypothetical protein